MNRHNRISAALKRARMGARVKGQGKSAFDNERAQIRATRRKKRARRQRQHRGM